MIDMVTLRDGRTVEIRPIRPSDAPLLQAGMERLSLQTRYRRFFSGKARLTRAEAEYLATVDFVDRAALVATVGEDIVAVARYDRTEPDRADVAVVVHDDFQHAGLGTILLDGLRTMAGERGIRYLGGDVLAENLPMLRMARARGALVEPPDHGVVRVWVPIAS